MFFAVSALLPLPYSAVTRACRVACGVSVPVRGVCDRTVITIGVIVTEIREAVDEGRRCEMWRGWVRPEEGGG